MASETDLYEDDFIGWTEQQAKALREAAQHGSNLDLDWEHLAEEIEDLGRSHRRGVVSEVMRIVEHLLKLEFSPARDPRSGWMKTIIDARSEVELALADEPGLRPRLPGILEQGRSLGARKAVSLLRVYGEENAATAAKLHAGQYTEEQILTEWFPDARAVPPG